MDTINEFMFPVPVCEMAEAFEEVDLNKSQTDHNFSLSNQHSGAALGLARSDSRQSGPVRALDFKSTPLEAVCVFLLKKTIQIHVFYYR